MRISAHGGGCCGMLHIQGMNEAARGETNGADSAKKLLSILLGNGTQDLSPSHNREVILSDRQTREMPELLKEMARVGFVYTTSWRGNHGTPVHLFHQTPQRYNLSRAHFYNTWVNEHNGMVAGPNLAGNLDDLRTVPNPEYRERSREALEENTRVTFTGPQEEILNTNVDPVWFGIIIEHEGGGWYKVRCPATTRGTHYPGETNMYRVSRRLLVPPPTVDNQPTIADPEQVLRHNTVAPAPEGLQPHPTRTTTLYYAFFQTGKLAGPYNTLEQARENHPRVVNYKEQAIYNDGTVRWFGPSRIHL